MVIALFPGQGSQVLGMGQQWFQDFALVRELFGSASECLKLDFKRLCFSGPEEELIKTENAQPALFLVSYAGFKILESEFNFSPRAGAGHSLGEYSALVCSGALDFLEGIRLTRRRGELMASALKDGDQGMLAVLGLSEEEVVRLCEQASEGEVLVPANFNAPGQVVISGKISALERAEKILKTQRIRAIRLKVSGAFHSSLMASAGEGLGEVLSQINFRPFRFPIVSNLTAQEYPSPESARELLKKQIVSPVRWSESVLRLKEMGAKAFIEIGPGKVLAGLVKKITPEIPVYNFSESKDLEELRNLF